MIRIDNRQIRRCLLMVLSLVAISGARVGAQANPDDQPPLPGNQVIRVGSSYYSSLENAIVDNNNTDFTATLATSTTLSERQKFPQGATLDLNNQTLTLYSGAELEVGSGKILKITKGTLSGSLAFSGSLLIGADVSMPGVSVREIAKSQNLYRILVTLPSADGEVSNLNYGPTEIINYARSGSSLCCWIPQSSVARMVTFSFKEKNGTGTKNFATEAVTVTAHAAATLATAENSSVVTYKAKAKPEGEMGYTSYESVYAALNAVASRGGDVQLMSTAPLGESVEVSGIVSINLDGNFLQASGTAALLTKNSGSVAISGGSLAGNLKIGDRVTIPESVVMAGCAVTKDGVQVYRLRLELPDGTTAASYSYGRNSGTLTVLTEVTSMVAYLWLPARSVAADFTLTQQGKDTIVRSGVVVEANHDNQIDLREGDVKAAVIYQGKTTTYTDFLKALDSVKALDGSRLELRADATVEGTSAFTLNENVTATIDLNGYKLIGKTGCLEAVADGSAYIISDATGRGSVTGTLLIEGCVYIGNDIPVAQIGRVHTKTSNAGVFRLLVQIDATVTDGFYNYKLGSVSGKCYVKDNQACLWLPLTTATGTLSVTVGENIYEAKMVTIIPAHSNIVRVHKPDEVATVNNKNFASLREALVEAAGQNDAIVKLLANVALEGELAVSTARKLTIDLNGFTLSLGTGSEWKGLNGGRICIVCSKASGSLSGNLKIEGNVVADPSPILTGLFVTSGVTPVYRMRLLLPITTTETTLEYSYNGSQGISDILTFTEDGETRKSAFIWLAAQSVPATLTATIGSDTRVRNNVTVVTNHDNRLDLMDSDKAVILYAEGETPGHGGKAFTTFHDALEAAAAASNSTLYLQADAELSGGSDHPHTAGKNSVITIELNGKTLTGGNCWLQSTEEGAAFLITDQKGTGSLTGTFRSYGNLMIDGHIPASKIGRVQRDATTTQYYRVQVLIAELDKQGDGFGTYAVGNGLSGSFYYKDKTACLWLPVLTDKLELTVEGKTYTASSVSVTASHSNVTTVHLPVAVARLNNKTYTSLADAIVAAALAATTKSGADAHIDLLSAAALDQMTTIDNYKLTIDLHDFTLTQAAGSGWKTTNGGSIYLKSSSKGLLASDFAISGSFCAGVGVSLNGTVTENNNPVYRVRFFLPEGTTSAKATYGNQTADLILPGESRDKQVVGYGFLQPSGSADLSVEVKGTNSTTLTLQGVSVQAFHNNQFDMESGTNPVRVENDQPYNTFELALMAVNKRGGGTIILNQNLALSGLQSVSSNVTVKLSGFTLALSTTAAFDVVSDYSLVISDESNSTPGNLYGTLLVNGQVYVSPEVQIAGMVIRGGLEVYRNCIEGFPEKQNLFVAYESEEKSWKSPVINGKACMWLPPVEVEHDQRLNVSGQTYEVTFLPTLPLHTLRYKAYPQKEVSGNTTWKDDTYKNYNVYLKKGATLTIAAGAKVETLHRLTMENDTKIECAEAVLAEAGIIYRRTFTKERVWEAFSLPYHARLIRSLKDGEVDSEIRPYQADGTGGDFWLKTISKDGEFSYVTEEQVVANRGYIIAVSSNMTTTENVCIDFVSSDRQFLNRSAMPLPTPEMGTFVQVAPGTLQSLKLERPFYQLSSNGTEYTRVDASTAAPVSVSPFSSFLLSDTRTMAANSVLRMSSFPTFSEVVSFPESGIRAYGQKGGIRVVCDRRSLLQIYSLTGILVWQENAKEGSFFISLPRGIYVVNREKVMVR